MSGDMKFESYSERFEVTRSCKFSHLRYVRTVEATVIDVGDNRENKKLNTMGA